MVLTAYPAVLDFIAMGLGEPLTKCLKWKGTSRHDNDAAAQTPVMPGAPAPEAAAAAARTATATTTPTRFFVFEIPEPGSEQPLSLIHI